MQNKTIEFDFLGQKIPLKSVEDIDFANEVVELVTVRLKEAKRRSKNSAPQYIALLALLDLAEEYLKSKKRYSEHRKKITQRSSELLKLLKAQ